MTRFVTAEPFPPGEYISEELEARGWTQDDLADVTGISRRQIINLIQGKSGITPETALALGQAFGQDPETWMHLQVSYELALAAQSDRDIARRARLFDKVPVREMKRRKWIKDVDDTDTLEQEVCRFLEVEKITEMPCLYVAARKGAEYQNTSPAQLAWFFQVRHAAKNVHAARYDDKHLEDGIRELLKLAAYPEDVRRVPRVLADMGIRLVIVQHLKGSGIDGVATWLNDGAVPVIGLSTRYDRIDNFWFTLMHELIHIKYRDESPVDVELTLEPNDTLPLMEQRANREASALLIAPDKMESFIARHKRMFYYKDVIRFAQARGIHPAIVAGQLKHRGEVPHNHLNKHKLQAKIREHIHGQTWTDGWGDIPV